jgi:hypothetical protein
MLHLGPGLVDQGADLGANDQDERGKARGRDERDDMELTHGASFVEGKAGARNNTDPMPSLGVVTLLTGWTRRGTNV